MVRRFHAHADYSPSKRNSINDRIEISPDEKQQKKVPNRPIGPYNGSELSCIYIHAYTVCYKASSYFLSTNRQLQAPCQCEPSREAGRLSRRSSGPCSLRWLRSGT